VAPYKFICWLPGFTGPVPPPLLIRISIQLSSANLLSFIMLLCSSLRPFMALYDAFCCFILKGFYYANIENHFCQEKAKKLVYADILCCLSFGEVIIFAV